MQHHVIAPFPLKISLVVKLIHRHQKACPYVRAGNSSRSSTMSMDDGKKAYPDRTDTTALIRVCIGENL